MIKKLLLVLFLMFISAHAYAIQFGDGVFNGNLTVNNNIYILGDAVFSDDVSIIGDVSVGGYVYAIDQVGTVDAFYSTVSSDGFQTTYQAQSDSIVAAWCADFSTNHATQCGIRIGTSASLSDSDRKVKVATYDATTYRITGCACIVKKGFYYQVEGGAWPAAAGEVFVKYVIPLKREGD